MNAPMTDEGKLQIDRQDFTDWLAKQTNPREPGCTDEGACFFGGYLKENGIAHTCIGYDFVTIGGQSYNLPAWAETASKQWCNSAPLRGNMITPEDALSILRQVE